MSAPGDLVMNALPVPVVAVGGEGRVMAANSAAEAFFDMSVRVMQRQRLQDLVPFGSFTSSRIRK